MRTLFVEADIGRSGDDVCTAGWSNVLSGETVAPQAAPGNPGLWVVPSGTVDILEDSAVSVPMVRAAFNRYLRDFDVIIVSAGSLQDRLSCQFVLSAADVGVLALRPSDCKAAILKQIDRFDSLPRDGSVAVMRNALPGDPWLAIRT